MTFYEIIRIVVLVVALLAVYFAVTMITMKRNIKRVIQAFEERDALDAKGAVSIADLGIRKQDFLERIVKMRDNRIQALKFLMDAGIVSGNADGRIYLNKKKMYAFRREGNFTARFIIPPQDY